MSGLQIRKIWRLLDWNDRDKAILVSAMTAGLFASYIGWLWFSATFSDFGQRFFSPAGLRITYLWNGASLITWLLLLVGGLQLRRSGRNPRVYTSACIFAYSISFLPLAHMIGLYNPLVGVILLGATMTGFVLFDMPRVLLAFALALLAIFFIAGLTITGVLEYAPLLRMDPVTKSYVSLYWVASTIICAVPFVAPVFFLTISLLERWRERERRIRILSTTDTLTGLPNRRALFQRFELELARARRQQEPLAVCVVDLDYFKQINDSHGHAVGDEVLQFASRILRSQLRDVDLLGRIGGEEFVIVLPDTDAAAAQRALERCRVALANNEVLIEDPPLTLRISASFGIYCAQVDEASNVPQLLARADEALYVAKRDGRNRLAFWGEAAAVAP